MSFVDMIKKSVISEFAGTITVDKILLSLLVLKKDETQPSYF